MSEDKLQAEQIKIPKAIKVRGARVHNLKNIDVDIPLNKIVGIAGVSGSGKSSLALGVLYAEGSRRYLESLSTYTRRRMTQAAKASVDEVLYAPASLALHQRPGVPGIRSTFGTGTELLNSLRLMFSRLAEHRCPNGHYLKPSLNVAAGRDLVCPECGEHFYAPGAEDLSFNSTGACRHCDGTGTVRTVDESTLVPDESLTIDEGAVLPWQTLMWSLMKDIARDHLGIRTDVPFKDLTERERELVFHGPADKHHMLYHNEKTNTAGEMDFTYFNAVYTVENALSHVKDEKGMKRVEKFLKIGPCPECGGSRLSEAARAPRLRGLTLADVCRMTLSDLIDWVKGVPESLPEEMRPMAVSICESFLHVAKRLMDLGLSYLTIDRESSTLSTGERQRMQLARAVRNRTTGVLYVLDEPSIGLHPANIEGVTGVMDDLVADGNSVILVDHDTSILSHADWLIEMGPGAGADGGRVIAEGTIKEIEEDPVSCIGPFLSGEKTAVSRQECPEDDSNKLFAQGIIKMTTGQIHTVQPLEVNIPKGQMTVITGVSGSGKTTMILESLIPALEAMIDGEKLPEHVREIEADGIHRVKLIDASPIGINVRSTVATYADVHDELRKIYAKTPDAKKYGYKAGDFSYNTGKLRCPVCDGTGSISLDVQFLPDVDIPCPDCRGARYAKEANLIRRIPKGVKAGSKQGQSRLLGEMSEPGQPKLLGEPSRPWQTRLLGELSEPGQTRLLGELSEQGQASLPGQPRQLDQLTTGYSLPELMDMSIKDAIEACADLPIVKRKLEVLRDLGLGYLTLGEETPSLSGGEAQRLKLASEMGRGQEDTLFVFDEPTIGLHPQDVQTLLQVFRHLTDCGATVVVIEHDLDVIRSADYCIDMGPGGGVHGGRIVACGTPEEIAADPDSITGKYLR